MQLRNLKLALQRRSLKRLDIDIFKVGLDLDLNMDLDLHGKQQEAALEAIFNNTIQTTPGIVNIVAY